MKKYRFITDCVSANGESISRMVDQAREVSFETFRRRTDWKPIAKALGYAVGSEPGLHLGDDALVRFYRSKFEGRPCYFMDWSRIEYVFA